MVSAGGNNADGPKLSIFGLGITAAVAAIGACRADPPAIPVRSRLSCRSRPAAASTPSADIFAAQLAERLKQAWVVENRPGAGGAVGLDSVAKAAPDGHTMVVMETSSVLQKWLHKNVPFDVVADFAPVAQIATTPLLLFANPSLPVSNLKDLIAYAKANPGKLSVGTPGIGTPHHLAAAMLNAAAGIDITHVPYKGTAPALNDLLGGQIPLIWSTPNVADAICPDRQDQAARGRLAQAHRAFCPNVPTVNESGFAGFDVSVWFGIAAPAKTPPDIVARVGAAHCRRSTKMPEVQQKTTPLGYDLGYVDSRHFAEKIADDHARYGKVIRDAGITPD